MMVEKEDLGLSLSLGSSSSSTQDHHRHPHSSLQLNLMPSSINSSPSPTPSPFFLHNKTTLWNIEAFGSSDRNNNNNVADQMFNRKETRSFLRGIDVNRMPAAITTTTATVNCEEEEEEEEEEEDEEEEEEAGVSSPNSTVSSINYISGNKRSERDGTNNGSSSAAEENDIELRGGGGGSDEEDGDTSRKKLRLSKDQSAILEESFKEHNTLNPKQKLALAKQLNLRPRQVEVWFQNRRARTKLKQTEVDCEFLKRCCENLTEENRRLQKEVQELRALKLSPQFYMQMTPPTTLTMCPSCERVGSAAPPITATGAASLVAHQHQHHQRSLPINAWLAPNPIHQRRP